MNYAFELHLVDDSSAALTLAQKLAYAENVTRDEFGQTQADVARSVERYSAAHASRVTPSKRAQYLAAVRRD